MPKDDLTKEDVLKLLTLFTTEVSKVHDKLDELTESITPSDLPDDIDIENLYGDNIPIPVETLVEMGKYLGSVPFFLGIT